MWRPRAPPVPGAGRSHLSVSEPKEILAAVSFGSGTFACSILIHNLTGLRRKKATHYQ